MKQIRANGGIHITLDFGNDMRHNGTSLHVIQFNIGGCKGNDILCGRKDGHSL